MDAIGCVRCQRSLPNRSKRTRYNDPWYAVVFQTVGNIGSMVFNEGDEGYLEINICDDCLMWASGKGLVLKYDDDSELVSKNSETPDTAYSPEPKPGYKPQLRLVK